MRASALLCSALSLAHSDACRMMRAGLETGGRCHAALQLSKEPQRQSLKTTTTTKIACEGRRDGGEDDTHTISILLWNCLSSFSPFGSERHECLKTQCRDMKPKCVFQCGQKVFFFLSCICDNIWTSVCSTKKSTDWCHRGDQGHDLSLIG